MRVEYSIIRSTLPTGRQGFLKSYSFFYWLRAIKRTISKFPGGQWVAGGVQKLLFRLWFRNQEELFTFYYNTNKWGHPESLSGPGSSLAATESIRAWLPGLLDELNVKSILDAPCGDYYWFRQMQFNREIDYVGGEIVKKAIEMNSRLYGNKNTRFMHLDILSGRLPDVDFWLCRDVLFHFSYSDIRKVIANLQKSDIRYFLTTTYPDTLVNRDIRTGGFRPVNLEKEPFHFPPPLRLFDDSPDGVINKRMGLWEIHDLITRILINDC